MFQVFSREEPHPAFCKARLLCGSRRAAAAGGGRKGRSVGFAALSLCLCCVLFSACERNGASPQAASSAVSSEALSSQQAVSSEAADSQPGAVSSEAEPSSSAASSVLSSSRQPASSILYLNTKYGLRVELPSSWKGYSVLAQTWQAVQVSDPTNEKLFVTGPEIVLRNPKWTKANPYQDIPILIFTIARWKQIEQDSIHIGAAPVGPGKLAGNSKYVFALPARYNFAFPTGYEEVDQLMHSGAVTAVES